MNTFNVIATCLWAITYPIRSGFKLLRLSLLERLDIR